ncbi:hypothetical protein BH24ACT5_BH24ACT5_28440 [soil metagenome]
MTSRGLVGRRRPIGARRHRSAVVLFGVSLALGGGHLLAGCGGDDAAGSFRSADAGTVAPAEIDFDYVIPAGTGDQIDAGDEVEILPAEIDATVGQVIRIVNDDERGFNVGPFFVGAGETITQRFSAAGEFTGKCAVHPSGQLVLRVRDRTAS